MNRVETGEKKLRRSIVRRIVLGFKGEKNMPKLNFSGNLPKTIINAILKLFYPTGHIVNDSQSKSDP